MIEPLHTRVAERLRAGGTPLTAAGVAEIDRLLVEERAGDCEPVCLRGEVHGAGVHVGGSTAR